MSAPAYRTASDLPDIVPVFPLPGALLLPRSQLPLHIFEPRYLAMVDDALASHRIIGMIQPIGIDDEAGLAGVPEPVALYSVGCAGRITAFAETGDGRMMITLDGVVRYALVAELAGPRPYRMAQVDFEPYRADLEPPSAAGAVDRDGLLAALGRYLAARSMSFDWARVRALDTATLVDTMAMACPFPAVEKQALLEAADTAERARLLAALAEMTAAEPGGSDRGRLQ